jgi:twitching motility protein PilT
VAAFEIMITTPAIQNLIRENKSYRITSAIQTGHKFGMNLLDEHLFAFYKRGICDFEELLARAQHAEEFTANCKALQGEDGAQPAAG